MSESVTVERGVRDRFGPQNEQLPVRQSASWRRVRNVRWKSWNEKMNWEEMSHENFEFFA
jgi:hypothetical protein